MKPLNDNSLKKSNKVEILAPAGGRQQLTAAVRCGANAVYLGTELFNARRNAENFHLEELPDVIEYCHGRDVKVHVALNTILYDNEVQEFLHTLKEVAKSGADAVIVQDLGAAAIVRDCCPDLEMHASTQMAIHNQAGVEMAQKLGFSRAVLARELSLEEIEKIAQSAEIDIEVFVHGALCASMSGMCYFSSMLGGRSGNRGLCAQPCRLNFTCRGREYALSLKDMSHVQHIRRLAEAGVSSFKIEGRMKRPEYVAAAVTACRLALQGEQPDMQLLKDVFSRGGLTDGYYRGKRTLSMYGHRDREDVEATAKVLGSISALYRNEYSHIPVDMELFAESCSSPVRLSVTDGTFCVEVYGEKPLEAQNRPADEAYVRRFLEKTGGTPFLLRSLNAHIGQNVMLPASVLNGLRREALEKLLAERSKVKPHEFLEWKEPSDSLIPRKSGEIPIRVRFEVYEQVFACDAEKVILPVKEIQVHLECISAYGERLIGEMPEVVFPEEESALKQVLKELRQAGLKTLQCDNLGAVLMAKELGFQVYGGAGLNVVNSQALRVCERIGVSDVTLSIELSGEKIKNMRGNPSRGIISYGYLPLMKLRNCPAQGAAGCGKCNGRPMLEDRKGVLFPLLCRNKRYTVLLNSVPLDVAEKKIENIDFSTLYFTVESREQCRKIYQNFTQKKRSEESYTNGLYFREVQ